MFISYYRQQGLPQLVVQFPRDITPLVLLRVNNLLQQGLARLFPIADILLEPLLGLGRIR